MPLRAPGHAEADDALGPVIDQHHDVQQIHDQPQETLSHQLHQQQEENDALLSSDELVTQDACGDRSWRAGWGWLQAVLILSAAFFCQFTAFHATQNLQSTLPFPPSVSGTTALGIVYLSSTASNPLGPRILSILRPKFCIMIGMACCELATHNNILEPCQT